MINLPITLRARLIYRGYRPHGTGSAREVWINRRRTRVLKIMRDTHSYLRRDNQVEYVRSLVYRQLRDRLTLSLYHYPVANCRFVPGTPILMMEYVEPLGRHERPDWSHMIDDHQVGRTRRGQIVAFDFAELPCVRELSLDHTRPPLGVKEPKRRS